MCTTDLFVTVIVSFLTGYIIGRAVGIKRGKEIKFFEILKILDKDYVMQILDRIGKTESERENASNN